MITNITLENFKCFRHVSINPKLLTVLIGPNGTGKSSVLQALLLLKQSVGEEQLLFQGEVVNFPRRLDGGVAPNFLPGREIQRIRFKGDSPGDYCNISYEYGVKISTIGLLVNDFGSILANLEGNRVELLIDEGDRSNSATIRVANVVTELARSKKVGELTEQRSLSGWAGRGPVPSEEIRYEATTLPSIVSSVLEDIKIVPSVRGLVRPRYELGDRRFADVSMSEGLSGQEVQTASNLGYGRQLEERLSDLLTTVTGTGLRAETVPPRSVEINSLSTSGPVNIVSEGFGANSLILLFLQLISAEKYATVLIEEPEIHLHPKAQADLAEVLAETAKDEDKQVVMTTHSEHLVERLLLLVAEGTLTPDDLAIFSFSKDEKGECSASEIKVTESGQVEGGLTDFYANNLDTLDRRIKALKQSK